MTIGRQTAPQFGLMTRIFFFFCETFMLFICVHSTHISSFSHFFPIQFFYSYYSNEVDNYGSPYGYSQSVATPQTIGYDISADFVDSTTAYEPRNNTIIDTDFIGMHSMYSNFISTFSLSSWSSSFFLHIYPKKYTY